MNALGKNLSCDEQRLHIMDAARQRFIDYGYGKTTMVEIAQDCACSAANLYRYFDSKQEIAVAVCQECMCERTKVLREIVRRPDCSAVDRLRNYVLGGLAFTREKSELSSKLNDLIAYILEQRKDLVHAKIQAQSALIAEVLAYGNETGEFDVDDVIATAQAIYASLTLFDVPIFQPLYSEEEFIKIANNTVNLLLKGLVSR